MKDSFGRDINYMRISLTDRCNLRCVYCMPEEGCEKLTHHQMLTYEEIVQIARAAAELGIRKIRLTGGEPLVKKGVPDLVRRLHEIEGIDEIALTTNGILLDSAMAHQLKDAGLTRVNISLDTFDADKYREITRGGDISKALAGINAAEEAGLTPIKINAVAIKGFNDDEFPAFAELTREKPIDVRFIELMPIGHARLGDGYAFISGADIRKMLPGLEPVSTDKYAVADYYAYPGAKGRVGFISALSNHFCGECNRIRLTSDGKLKPCLHSNEEIDIKHVVESATRSENVNEAGSPIHSNPHGGDSIEIIREVLENAILHKPAHHLINEGAAPIDRDMNAIGG